MPRRPKYRYLRNGAIAIAALGVISYGADALLLHYRAVPYADVRVDSMYAVKNRWNEVEYSVGSTGSRRCVNSAFPHQGYSPCWYLNRHAMTYIRVG